MPTITISDFAYKVTGAISAGATVMVHNEDAEAHTVTSDDGHSFAVTVPAGATVHFTAPTAGTYAYHCVYHGSMHGTLHVT